MRFVKSMMFMMVLTGVLGIALTLYALGASSKAAAQPAVAQAATAQATAAPAATTQAWGAAQTVRQVDQLYFAGQPDAAALEAAQDNGVTTVINLRTEGEMDWDEQAAAEALGMQYVHIPFDGRADAIDGELMQRITDAVEAAGDGPVLLHCASGNRVAAWYATHLVRDLGVDADAALETADMYGLTSPALRERVQSFLKP